MKTIGCIFFSLLLWNTFVFAGGPVQIEFNDGSVIKGEIISFQDGLYTIQSDSLGAVKIKASKIHIIRSMSGLENSSDVLKQSSLPTEPQVEDLMNKMMSDEQIMDVIFSLQNDLEIKNILNDPVLLNAVNAGDIDALKSNPVFMNLLQNKKIQHIEEIMNQE